MLRISFVVLIGVGLGTWFTLTFVASPPGVRWAAVALMLVVGSLGVHACFGDCTEPSPPPVRLCGDPIDGLNGLVVVVEVNLRRFRKAREAQDVVFAHFAEYSMWW